MTASDGHQTPAWRSAALVLPLLIMAVGTLVTGAVAIAVWQASGGSFPDYITLLGLLLTGLVVGLVSPDARLGMWAAVIIAALLGISMAVLEATANGPAWFLVGAAFATGLMLLFIGLGFGLGRLVKSGRGRPADATSHR